MRYFLCLFPLLLVACDSTSLSGEIAPWVATVVLVPLIGWLGKLIREAIKTNVSNSLLQKALVKTSKVVTGQVSLLAQELADAWKEASADGKLSDDEKKQLMDLALGRAKRLLDVDTWTRLETEFGGARGAEEYVKGEIEHNVRKIKNSKGMADGSQILKTIQDGKQALLSIPKVPRLP